MRRLFLSLSLTAAFIAPFAGATQARAEEFTRAQIEDIIKDYISKNPQVIIDSVESFGREQQRQDDEAASKRIMENKDWLYNNKNHAQAGNPKATTTIVEFFDYNCGYCKAAVNDLMTMLEDDKDLRIVFVEIPILGDSSTVAARWALAAMKQDSNKYLPFHLALMRHKGPLDEFTYLQYAKTAGLDLDKLKVDRSANDIAITIDDNLRMARTLGITGTPAFVIGDQLVRGFVGKEGLQEAVKYAREKHAKSIGR